MPTVYKRILTYCTGRRSRVRFSPHERSQIGKIVLKAWFDQKVIRHPIQRVPTKEKQLDTPNAKVLSYPRVFAPTIDKIIDDFFRSRGAKIKKPFPSIPQNVSQDVPYETVSSRNIRLCSKCKKPVEASRLASNQKYCISCHAEYMRNNRTTYSEMTEEQKLKSNARAYARTYLVRGNLEKKPCEVCGSADVEMHHDDYNKPLEIRWLCRVHHLDFHDSNRPSNSNTVSQGNISHRKRKPIVNPTPKPELVRSARKTDQNG